MASLKGLERLDVSRNNLSSVIAKGLEKLLFLKYLNISFNDIEGALPTVGVFKNVDAISIIGNNKLCGAFHSCNYLHAPKLQNQESPLLLDQ